MLTADEILQARASPAGLAFGTSAWIDEAGRRRHRWIPFKHLILLNDAILRATSGQLAREGKAGLIVSMPPRHGKSETVSRALPAWYLGTHPDREVILASYGQRFANTWGRKARDLLTAFGPEVFGVTVSDSSSAADLWEVAGRRGRMHVCGRGGVLTGFGADLLVVDDPLKDMKEAQSDVIREDLWDWWLSTARSRIHAGGTAIVMATRWHEADLIGMLIDRARDDPKADQWEVINLPLIAEPDEQTGEMNDPLGRTAGQALCPELGYDEEWAQRTKHSGEGLYTWYALYQGQPRPADGLLFKRTDFRYFTVEQPSEQWPDGLYLLIDEDGGIHPVDPRACGHFQTADTAASEKEMADYTVVCTWAVTPVDRKLLLIHVERGKFEDTRVGAMVESEYTASHDPQNVPRQRPGFVSVENAGPSGPKVIKHLLAQGIPVRSANPDTDKVTRSLPAVALCEAHRLYWRKGAGWLRDWEHEHLGFPNAAHDDQVDNTSYAAIELPRVQFASRRQKGGRGTELGGLANKQL